MSFRMLGLLSVLLLTLGSTGCQVSRASGITVADATLVMPQGAGRAPATRVYRQYQVGNEFLQFERFEGNMLYGFRSCNSQCPYTRIPFSASFDGTYLNLAYGHHADLYTTAGTESLYPNTTGNASYDLRFSSLWRYTIQGRNLIADSILYKCDGVAIWHAEFPVFSEAGAFCKPNEGASVNANWVAMTDEVLTGADNSIQSPDSPAPKAAPAAASSPAPAAPPPEAKGKGDVEERLRQLKTLHDNGVIDAATYEKKKNAILEDL